MFRQAVSLRLALILVFLIEGRGSLAQSPQPINIFGNAVPSNFATPKAASPTLGVKFWSSESGSISAILFYRGSVSPQGYLASLYSASGTLLGSVKMAGESGPVPGWQEADFAAPIPISPNTT